ncbi:MAG: hypothetical protein R3A13_04105 [Bdellovibrionota bacterium]
MKGTVTYRVWSRFLESVDPWERKKIKQMRQEGKFLYLSELIPHFQGTSIYSFGTGGSVSNLSNLERIREKNLMIVTSGPVHFNRVYGVVPNIWLIHNTDSVKMFLKEEESDPLDFSDTFIFVPANDSYSKLYFSSRVIQQLRDRHPEATFVVYREIFPQIDDFVIPKYFMRLGYEPLRALHGSVLEALFIPLAGYLGISSLYFSGIDQLPTGHFWDRKFNYQSIDGKPLDFPAHENTLKINKLLSEFCPKNGLEIFRLEKEETLLKIYPYVSFDESFSKASAKITPATIRKDIPVF